jgi:3-isopropylmalate/(R)-2-methylmalate dehydratase small subunit
VNQRVSFSGQTVQGAIRESARDALINGRWDPIGELIEGASDASAIAGRLPYMAV